MHAKQGPSEGATTTTLDAELHPRKPSRQGGPGQGRDHQNALVLERHHATLFVDPTVSAPLELLRAQWDPAMSRQIAAYVTLIYPWEAPDPALIADRVSDVAGRSQPFRLRVEDFVLDGPEAG